MLFLGFKCRACREDVVMVAVVGIRECLAITLFLKPSVKWALNHFWPQALTLLMAASESHERQRLIGLAQMQ